MPFPKISIVFCVKCKWNLRSAWYLQELLQTFGDELKEVSLVPGQVGTFKILGYKNDDNQGSEILLWDRSVDGGFPDSKYLKQRVKALLFEDNIIVGAHINRKASAGHRLVNSEIQENSTVNTITEDASEDKSECVDCKDDGL